MTCTLSLLIFDVGSSNRERGAGREQPEGRYVWTPAIGRTTRVVDRSLLEENGAGTMARFVRQPYDIGLFLRRLTVSEVASEERCREYRRVWEEVGRPPWLPPELPPGKTFVIPHARRLRA